MVVPAALTLIFLLLFTTLGSVRQAVLVLANIPFALVGGVLALWAIGEYLSVPASVGFIALMGIAVLNGLVMMGTHGLSPESRHRWTAAALIFHSRMERTGNKRKRNSQYLLNSNASHCICRANPYHQSNRGKHP